MNRFLARWLDETEESRFDVEHVPGRLIPAYPLTHSRFLGPAEFRVGARCGGGPPMRDRCGGVRRAWTRWSGRLRVGYGGGPLPGHVYDLRRRIVGARLRLANSDVSVLPNLTQPNCHFLAPEFFAAWQREAPLDPFFGPIIKGTVAKVGSAVDRHGSPVATNRPASGAFLICCCLLSRRGQSEPERL